MGPPGAMEWAASARRAREQLVAALTEGEIGLPEAMARAAADPLVARIDVLTVVESLPDWGKVRARRALAASGIDPRTPLGEVDGDSLVDHFGPPR